MVRNDKASVEEMDEWEPERIVISPGPRTPREAGVSTDVVRHFGPKLPVLGVCLGHQCIGRRIWRGGGACRRDHARQVVYDPSRRQGGV